MKQKEQDTASDELDEWGQAKVEKKYLHFLKGKGMSTNEVLRLFAEGKLMSKEERKEEAGGKKEEFRESKGSEQEEKTAGEILKMVSDGKVVPQEVLKMIAEGKLVVKGEAKEDTEGAGKKVSKILEKIEEAGAEQIAKSMEVTMEQYQRRMEELQEKAKKAEALEREILEKQIETLRKEMKDAEAKKEEQQRELIRQIEALKEALQKEVVGKARDKELDVIKQRYREGSADQDRIVQLEAKLSQIADRLENRKSAVEQLQEVVGLKKALDDAFVGLYLGKQDKIDMKDVLQILGVVMPTVNNAVNNLIGTWTAMKQVDVVLAKAEKATNPAVAERYLRQADMLMERIAVAGTHVGNPTAGNHTGNLTAGNPLMVDQMAGLLNQASKEDIEKFKKGDISIVKEIENYMGAVVSTIRGNPALLEQLRRLEPEEIIKKVQEARKDIEVDDVLKERIRSEFTAIKEMILSEIEGGGGGNE
jgi:hypothetical protein